MSGNITFALDMYHHAAAFMTAFGYQREIEWQRSRVFASFCESDLLREGAWVILCSGFKEALVRRHFGYISLCFCDWESAETIAQNACICRQTATAVFRHSQKIEAIVDIAKRIVEVGFEELKAMIVAQPLAELQKLPFIGPTTTYHLAKNLGLPVSKPDRHLLRLAHASGFKSPFELCEELAARTGEDVQVIDLILWRYAAEVRGG
jgi:hypothetical protein